jgi:serine/threonine-protein kinase
LKKVPVTGGASLTICEAQGFNGATWGPDETIIFANRGNKGLLRVAAAGGQPHVLAVANPKKGEDFYAWPHFLPGGQAVLFSIQTDRRSWDEARIAVLNLRTGEQRVLLEGGSSPHYVPTGHLSYARAGLLYAVPFDPRRLQLKGSPVPVLEDLEWFSLFGYGEYSFSASDTLVYFPRAVGDRNRTMMWVDRKGAAVPLPAPLRAYANPSVSPDGQRIAVNIAGERLESWDIWIYEQSRGTLTPLTSGLYNLAPVWTPDGKRVTFRSRSEAGKNISWMISWIPANGTGSPEPLLRTDLPTIPGSWSPDGRFLAFQQGPPGRTEILLLPNPEMAGGAEQKPRPFIAAGRGVWGPQISPDGRWIAYTSFESGTSQVYVQSFPGPGEKWPISSDRGEWPRWARNGRELFYRNGDKMMVVEIAATPDFRAGKPKVLFEGHYEASPDSALPTKGYDVSPDGKRFLMIKGSGEQAAPVQVHVVQDWFEELKRRVPSGK